jgi:hypothetical protein
MAKSDGGPIIDKTQPKPVRTPVRDHTPVPAKINPNPFGGLAREPYPQTEKRK